MPDSHNYTLLLISKQIFHHGRKIYELQKENVSLARQLLRLSEDLQMAHERIDELEKTLKGKRMINPYMKIVTPGK